MGEITTGINWFGINTEVKNLNAYFSNFSNDVFGFSNAFADELSYLWASGNAAEFGGDFSTNCDEMFRLITNSWNRIVSCISNAAASYAKKFDTPNMLNISHDLDYPNGVPNIQSYGEYFQKVLNGITGMNKVYVQDLIEKYFSVMQSSIEELYSNISGFSISLLDENNAQKEAFNLILDNLVSGLNKEIDEIVRFVKLDIGLEYDNLNLSREKVESVFNA